MTSLHPMLSIGRQLTEHVRRHLGLGRTAATRQRASSCSTRCGSPIPRARSRAYPHQFSGGMRQRIAIAIALACSPRLLIADEPTTALDVTVQAGIIRLLDRLRRERGLAVILITHDLGVMSSIADRVAVFYAGRVVESGPRADVLRHPRHPYTRGAARRAARTRRRRPTRRSCRSRARRRPPRRPARAARSTRAAGTPSTTARTDDPAARRRSDGRRFACPVDPLRAHEQSLELRGRRGRVRAARPSTRAAVAGASLAVERGQIVGLVGE